MFPNVADFVEKRDGIFVHVQRLRGVKRWGVRPTQMDERGNWTHTQHRYRCGPSPVTVSGVDRKVTIRCQRSKVQKFGFKIDVRKDRNVPEKGQIPSAREV